MDRDELARQGKQRASDLRDTVGQKVSQNQDTIKGTLGKAARWFDDKTGGKYSEQIGKAQSKVDDGIGKLAAQGSTPPDPGAPGSPGAAAGDPPTGPTTPSPSDGPTAPGPTTPGSTDRPAGPADSSGPAGPPKPPTETPTVPPTPRAAQPPVSGDDPDDAERPRPPQV